MQFGFRHVDVPWNSNLDSGKYHRTLFQEENTISRVIASAKYCCLNFAGTLMFAQFEFNAKGLITCDVIKLHTF